MRLAASLASLAVASLAVSTWSTAARADDVASPGPPLAAPGAVAAPAPVVDGPSAVDVPAIDPPAIAPPPPAYEAPARQTSHWYGGQILAVDGASLGGGLALGLLNPGAGGALFLGGYVLGGPLVHVSHGRPLAALGSFALRLAAPTLGALTGYSIVKVSSTGSNDGFWNDAGAATLGGVGLLLGYATAIALDSALLAHEEVRRDSLPGGASKGALPGSGVAFTWTPSVAPVHDGAVAGIVGRF